KLTPMVVMQALEDAGTVVCEPNLEAGLEVPTAVVGSVLSVLGRLGASVRPPSSRGELSTVDALIAVPRVQVLVRQLPGLTRGEGVLETRFGGYVPVVGPPPNRARTTANPLHRAEYLMYLRSPGTK